MFSTLSTRRAVVIEDDPDIRELLVHVLRGKGFEVYEAGTGDEGIDVIRETRPELVTLDLNLPDVDGLEVCRVLRGFSNAFIIMITARGTEIDRLNGLDTGADDYITKPFSIKEFQARVDRLFRRVNVPLAATGAQPPVPDSELVRAAEVQRSLLPGESPELDEYDVAGGFRPSRSVGGDFYDWYPTQDGMHLTFADAMGKGMGAALIAATARAVMRSVALESDVGQAFESASRTIEGDLEQSGSFITLFHARLHAASGKVSYVDAGHGLALHIPAAGPVLRLPSAGAPVGAWTEQRWQSASIELAPGDALVVVSDGVLDAFATIDEFTAHIAATVREHASAEEACNAILHLAPDWEAEDDVTVVMVRRTAGFAGSKG